MRIEFFKGVKCGFLNVITHIEDFDRCLSENNGDKFKVFEIQHMNACENNNYHINVMIEMIVLSKCAYFIHRVSDFANFAIIYSDTFKIIECL